MLNFTGVKIPAENKRAAVFYRDIMAKTIKKEEEVQQNPDAKNRRGLPWLSSSSFG